jgi:alpha-beta hydrolase superfamily lysophospholipase
MNWKRIKRWLTMLLVVYVVGGVALYFLQDAILFHPVQLKRAHRYEFREAHEDISIPVNKEDTLNLVRFFGKDSTHRGAVLYFHGNKKNISWYARFAPYFTRHGYEVIMIDYPGFGKSTGQFTEKRLYEWAEHVYKFARSYYPADSIIIYGKSMGTGIAAYLASRVVSKRVILETPYYDMPSVIQYYLPVYPVGKLLHYKLPNYQYLQFIRQPVSIIHGTDDGVIRYRNARRLQRFLKSSDEFITIEDGSHNDLYSYPLTVRKLDSLLRL